MKLATLRNGAPDGQLAVVSKDLKRFTQASAIAPTLQAALDDWDVIKPELEKLSDQLNAEDIAGKPFDAAHANGTVATCISMDRCECIHEPS